MKYDLTSFEAELKALLRKAEDMGLNVEEFCSLTEHVIENGWGIEAPEGEE